MKRIILIFSLMTLVMTASAVPAKRGVWKTLKLADGKEVRAQLVGDEFGHCWKAENGKAYLQAPNADFFEAINTVELKEISNARRQRTNTNRFNRLSQMKKISPGNFGSYIGTKKGLILLVNFKNVKFKQTHNIALYDRIANEEGYTTTSFRGSMSDYFRAQSYGKFDLNFDIYGPFEMEYDREHYGENDRYGNDKHPGEMVIEAVNQAKSFVEDWHQYDWDGDGKVDQVFIIYAEKGSADTGITDAIWPHAYTLTEARDELHDGSGPVKVSDDPKLEVDTYACGPELNASGKVDGIGTMCHEFSHCLGFPDFYDTDYSGGQGMSYWDLMDSGSYNGNGYVPAGYTSYERWMAGWMEPIVLEDEDVRVTGMKSLQSGGESYIIYNKRHRDEYYLLENRQFTGWDLGLPGSGLLILHVDFLASAWENNTPNDNPKRQRMTWIPADNEYQYETYDGQRYWTEKGMENDPFPYKSKNSFNKSTVPAAQFNNKSTANSYYLESSVENIAVDASGNVSFNFVASYDDTPPDDDEPSIVLPSTVGAVFYESFDGCNGKGGNDDQWNGLVGSATSFKPDNEGWTSSRPFGANQCAKFGTSSEDGSATTPAFNLEGKGKLYFRAGGWDVSGNGTTLNVTAQGATLNPTSVTLKLGKFKTYEIGITAKRNTGIGHSAPIYITFECPGGRFFLDDVLVKPNTISTDIIDIEETTVSTSRLNEESEMVYDLQGRRVNNS